VTYWQLDGGSVDTGTSVPIDAEGDHILAFWSVDAAGNSEQTNTIHVRIDKTAPTITHTLAPAPNAAGWNTTSVTVTFSCGDALSGIAVCTPAQALTADGVVDVAGKAVDNAGTATTDTAHVQIDKTPPTIAGTADRAPNAQGWYSAPVVVGFTCGDALSGVASCTLPVTVGEGKARSASGAAVDVAGNRATTNVGPLNVDLTAPTIAFGGNAGTYAADQTVAITCTAADALSGVGTSTCAPIAGPAWSFGVGQTTRTATATDLAGNTATASTTFTVTVAPASLCALTTQFLRSSTKYQRLPDAGKRGADALASAVCQTIANLAPKLGAAQKAVLVQAYGAGLDGLVRADWLTAAQATTLKALAGRL
jgi:hypothetical protein